MATISDLEHIAASWDAAVDATPGIDPFCARSDWIIPYFKAFCPMLPLHIKSDAQGAAAMVRAPHHQLGELTVALEHAWCFAAPCAGARGPVLLTQLVAEARPWPISVLLTGLPRALLAECAGLLGDSYEIFPLKPTLRVHASLEHGLDGYLARRSRNFRRNARRVQARLRDAGITIERHLPRDDSAWRPLYEVVLDVERRSWKGHQEVGVDQGPMAEFYRLMWPRLAARGALRVLLARRGDDVVGAMHGGCAERVFRGLQLSQDRQHSAHAIGNALHLRMIEWLCEDGFNIYDLGQDVPYKHRWGEQIMATDTVVMIPYRARRTRVHVQHS